MPFNALWLLSDRLDWSMHLLKTSLTGPYPPPRETMLAFLKSPVVKVTKVSLVYRRVVRKWSPLTPGAAATVSRRVGLFFSNIFAWDVRM